MAHGPSSGLANCDQFPILGLRFGLRVRSVSALYRTVRTAVGQLVCPYPSECGTLSGPLDEKSALVGV